MRVLRVLAVPGAALCLVAATPSRTAAWGEAGHRLVARAAVEALPPGMPGFFTAAAAQLEYLNPEPDRWRSRLERDADPALDGGTAPEHFIDLELVPPGALEARDKFEFVLQLERRGVRRPLEVGVLPYHVLELVQRLREEWRLWRAAPDAATRRHVEQRIVNDAGILGHYVADGANPHHTTIHYNGWSGPNPAGYATDRQMHARFESIYVGAHLGLDDVTPLVRREARVVAPLRLEVIRYLRESNARVEKLYQLDQAEPFGLDTRGEAHRAFTASRLAAGAAMLRDLWWTAWVTSELPAGDSTRPGDRVVVEHRPPRPDDVATLDGLVRAFYEAVSGPAGQPREWWRDRALYLPDVRFVAMDVDSAGRPVARVLDHQAFVDGSDRAFRRDGFFETEIGREVERFGNTATIRSAYETRRRPDGPVLGRGINSIHAFWDGARWWIASVVWDEERPGNPIPPALLRP